MPDTIYNREQLRKRVLEQLRQRGERQTTGEVAVAIGVQTWAAEGTLEELRRDREVSYEAAGGWQAVEPASTARRAPSDDAQTPLGV